MMARRKNSRLFDALVPADTGARSGLPAEKQAHVPAEVAALEAALRSFRIVKERLIYRTTVEERGVLEQVESVLENAISWRSKAATGGNEKLCRGEGDA